MISLVPYRASSSNKIYNIHAIQHARQLTSYLTVGTVHATGLLRAFENTPVADTVSGWVGGLVILEGNSQQEREREHAIKIDQKKFETA